MFQCWQGRPKYSLECSYIVIWEIWRERDRWIFKGKEEGVERVKSKFVGTHFTWFSLDGGRPLVLRDS